MDIKLPPLGEGVDSGTVVALSVKEGDDVTKGQGVIEIETGKAVAPVPSPRARRAPTGEARPRKCLRRAPLRHNGFGDRAATGHVAIQQVGVRALTGEEPRHRLADSRGGAGDQRHSILQHGHIRHGHIITRRRACREAPRASGNAAQPKVPVES